MPEGNHAEMSYNFKRDTRNIFNHIRRPAKNGGCMPYASGNLANNATQCFYLDKDTFCIAILGDVAPYAPYLNEGTIQHDIPNSFNRGPKFGIGGRFFGKFHPGSIKWIGFIDDVLRNNSIMDYTLNYFIKNYGAVVAKVRGNKDGF